jgi:hypothetical protein
METPEPDKYHGLHKAAVKIVVSWVVTPYRQTTKFQKKKNMLPPF